MPDYKTILKGDLKRVTRPAGFTFDDVVRRRDHKRRNQRIAAGIVGFAVFVSAVWFVASARPVDPAQAPTVPGGAITGPTATGLPSPTERVGFIGLPPEGAAPSIPRRGELVLHFYGGTTSSPRTEMWVYADGRFIWRQELVDLPFGANPSFTGYLEQHLTDEGVELLRSEVVATGLFEESRDLKVGIGPCLNLIEVRNGERLVRVTYSRDCEGEGTFELAAPEEAEAIRRLDGQLGDVASWLPASAWEDPEIRAYVPSRFAICYSGDPTSDQVEASRLLDLLPPRAAALLREKDRTSGTGFFFNPPEVPEPSPFGFYCSSVTTREARVLARVLDGAGYRPPDEQHSVLSYVSDAPAPVNRVSIEFEPIFPHGEWTCSACG